MPTPTPIELFPLAVVGEDWVSFMGFLRIPDGVYSLDDPKVRAFIETWKTASKSSSP